MIIESRGDPIRPDGWEMGPAPAGKRLNRHRLQVGNSIQAALRPEIMMLLACYAGRVAQSAEIANEWLELRRKQQHQAISEPAGDVG